MPKSTAMITDIGTVITNGPNAATVAKAIAPAGPIQDYQSNCKGILLRLQECVNLLGTVKSVTVSGDATELGLINGLIAVANGTANPSTQVITDAAAAVAAGPNAGSAALAIAPSGPILDFVGCLTAVQTKFREMIPLLTYIKTATDSTDSANLTLINNLLLVLV